MASRAWLVEEIRRKVTKPRRDRQAGLGAREIGPHVHKRMCDDTPQTWPSGDYTAAFSKIPATLAEAESAN
jgi:hypothetical protein